jgi:hypothetical protein
MRRKATLGAVLAGTLLVAASAPASDIYIWGSVQQRVPGKHLAVVQMKWAYKCLGDKLGSATYDWTLKVRRRQPLPETVTTLGHGTSKFGTLTVTLPPGDYLPFSDPYFCETDRGAGYSKPEVGAPFTVPDYCAWTVSAARGFVQLERGSAVKLVKPGTTVTPGDLLATPKGGSAALASVGRDGTVAVAAASQLVVDGKQCAAKGGWRIQLSRGGLTAAVQRSALRKSSYVTATPNSTVSGLPGARWRVDYAKRKTRVRALAGSIRVAKTGKAPSILKAGQKTTIG